MYIKSILQVQKGKKIHYNSPDFFNLLAVIWVENFLTIVTTLPRPKYLESLALENSWWHVTLNNTLNPYFTQLDPNKLKNSAGGLVQRLGQDDTFSIDM